MHTHTHTHNGVAHQRFSRALEAVCSLFGLENRQSGSSAPPSSREGGCDLGPCSCMRPLCVPSRPSYSPRFFKTNKTNAARSCSL